MLVTGMEFKNNLRFMFPLSLKL